MNFDLSQVKLRFAQRGEELLHVRSFDHLRGSTKGRPTDLTCPECEARVVPVLSPTHQITDHFRHESETSCVVSGSGESAVHLNAKAVLAQELNKFHSASLVHQCVICGNWYAFLKIEYYDYAKAELKIVNRRRPDVSCVSGDDVVGAAEIFHTHAVDFEKKADLNAAGLTWFEIPAASVHRQYFKRVEAAHIFSIDARGAGVTYPVPPRYCEVCQHHVSRRVQADAPEMVETYQRSDEAQMRRAVEWRRYKEGVMPKTREALLVAGCEAEGITPELDKYGIRLMSRMSSGLYVAVANHRNQMFLQMARQAAVVEE